MSEVLITDRPRFGRDSLLWRDSDEVWRPTRPFRQPFEATRPAGGPVHTVSAAPRARRSLMQRLADAWAVFNY